MVRVGLATFTLFVSFGCLLPVFPLWAKQLGGSLTEVGFATTFAAGVGLIAARPVAARLMEGRRRLPVYTVGVLVCGVSILAFPRLPTFGALLVLRLVQGFGFALVGTAGIAAITDLAPPARRGEIMGYYGAGNALSLLLGPALGAWLAAHMGLESAFEIGGALCFLALVFLPGIQEPPKPALHGPLHLLAAWKGPLRLVVLAHFFGVLIHGVVLAFLPLRFERHPGWMDTATFFALDGAFCVLLRVLVGKRFDTLGRAPFLLGGLACFVLAGLGLALSDSDWVLAAAGALYGLAFGAYIPALSALVADVVEEVQRARGFALYLLSFDLSVACAGLAFGPIADALGLAWTFALAGAMSAVAFALLVMGRPWRTAP